MPTGHGPLFERSLNIMMNFDNVETIFNVSDDTILTTDDINHGQFNKPKEYIEMDERLSDILMKVLPKDYYSGDFIVGNTIPSPDIELRCGNFTAQIMVYTPQQIFSQINEDIAEYFFIAGEIKITANVNINGSPRPITTYSPLILNKENMHIGVHGSFIQIPKMLEFAKEDAVMQLGELLASMREVAIATWMGVQIALLNPIIKERTRIETVPAPADSKSKHKKGPKKYVKRITIGDISDMEFGEKKTKHIKEPFWWVSGHWREYKSGKKIFINGYWKGPFREFGQIREPRERQIVVE